MSCKFLVTRFFCLFLEMKSSYGSLELKAISLPQAPGFWDYKCASLCPICYFAILKKSFKPGKMAEACNPSTWEIEERGSKNSRPAWSTGGNEGQLGQAFEPVSQKVKRVWRQ